MNRTQTSDDEPYEQVECQQWKGRNVSNELPASSMVLLAARAQRRASGEFSYSPLEMTPRGGLHVSLDYPRVGPSLFTLTAGKSLRAVLNGAITTAQPSYVVNYSETTDGSLKEESTEGALNSTTEVILVPTPSANFKRMIQQVVVCNIDSKPVYLSLYIYTAAANYYLLNTFVIDTYVSLVWSPNHLTLAPGSIIP